MARVTTESINLYALTEGLNPAQREAATTLDGPVLVLAGAGSGKTSVMTRRIAVLMAARSLKPWNVLAITFTNKAAREMTERVRKLIGDSAEDLWMGTFHAICVRILRREAERMGYTNSFTILDADDQMTAIKQCMLDLNYDLKKFDPGSIHWKISAAKNELLSPDEMGGHSGRSALDRAAVAVYREYQIRLKRNNAFDFDDLILTVVNLFESHPDVLEAYQQKFLYIHVDEYQDTNRAQYRLVNLLAQSHHNLCVVGDSDQAIYRWRGADIRNIANFERDYPEAKVILLEQNYRSTNTILQAANAVIRNNENRKEKNLWSANGQGEPITLYAALDQADEAAYVISKVQEHVGAGGMYRDCTILYRANAQSRALEEAFIEAGVPYRILGGLTFYDRREIKDVMAYLKAITNPQDEISLLRIVNVPKRNIGEGTIRRLLDFAHDRDLTLLEAMGQAAEAELGERATTAVTAFHALMADLAELQQGLSVREFVDEMLEKTGYRAMYAQSSKEEDQNRLENVEEMLSVARGFDRRRGGTVADFIAETSLLSDVDKESGKQENAVLMMTVHASKGLEFPIVFVVGVEESIFPHARSMESIEDVAEERNLCYVAITRAKERLYMTYCAERTLFGDVQMNDPSRFLGELPVELTTREGSHESVEPTWSVGLRLRHPQFGVGVVTDLREDGEDVLLTVTFGGRHGTKDVSPKRTKVRVLAD